MKKTRKGFTLVEILIVVVILGILAAIVIPQFSQASTDSKVSSLQSNLQTIRSQIALYKIQHNDVIPVDGAALITALTTKTDVNGDPWTAGAGFGPYLQVGVPGNPFVGNVPATIGATGASTDWIYEPDTTDNSWTFSAGPDTTADSAAHMAY